MKTSPLSRAWKRFAAIGLVLIAGAAIYPMTALQTPAPGLGYIRGVVRSTTGPEAGVWVIAETKDLPTGMIKSVVTDDQGRYMLPDMPTANYSVWVRGYGLADSRPIAVRPTLNTNNNAPQTNLTAVIAKDDVEAAKVYPGNYWMQMIEPPARSAFPLGTSRQQASLEGWMHSFKSSCNFCHQLGNPITRTLDHVYKAKPELKTSQEAWDYRLQTGVRGSGMSGSASGLNRPYALKMFADWTDRIAKGETPKVKPPRPTGIERNVVITQWDWGTDHSFMHDQVATSKYQPWVGGGGKVWAVSAGHGTLVMLDPKTNETSEIEIPTRQERSQIGSRFPPPNPPSLWWGDARLWNGPTYSPSDPHNPMMDNKGRVWLTSKIRAQAAAPWCSDNTNKYVSYWGPENGGRQASYYDPKTQKFQLIETCYATHHVQIDNDANETVWFNELSGPTFGFINAKLYDETLAATKDESKAEQAAVGWCNQTLDTNGDGRITKPFQTAPLGGFDNLLYATDTAVVAAAPARGAAPAAPAPAAAAPRGGAAAGAPPAGAAPAAGAPGAAGGRGGRGGGGGAGGGGGRGGGGGAPVATAETFNAQQDTLLERGGYSLYSVIPSPVDDSVWGVAETFPGYLVRLKVGPNPPETCMTQIFKVPAPGLDPRGVDIDSNGVVWTALAASSHLASFDPRKCTDLNGPAKLDGSQCANGWKLYQTTGPRFQGTDIPTEFHYFNWTDQQGASGFPPNTPMATGSNSDSINVLLPNANNGQGQWVDLRIPYPLGFYARGLDARVERQNAPAGFAGWKDRAIWSNYGTHFVWHIEGGKGVKGKEVRFQVRQTPLDR
jgi:hypothetical protein